MPPRGDTAGFLLPALRAVAVGWIIWKLKPLKLTAEQFPLPCSLQKRVLERHGSVIAQTDSDLAMNTQELLTYLRNIDCDRFSPLQGVVAQTEAIGDPALPSREQTATLKWVGTAIQEWQQQFPLEEPLAGQLRRVTPLVAAVAVTDPDFFTPGAHPLHQLLDTFHQLAIGWQPGLGRAGKSLEEQVRKVVDSALSWFDSQRTDLAAITQELKVAADRSRAATGKVVQRLVEAESGRLRFAASRRQAARMINAALEEFLAPPSIGEFIRGPWYESAQLVLLKFGEASSEWETVSLITTKLLFSLQMPAAEVEGEVGRRQYIFELVSQLPDDLRRWHISNRGGGEDIDKTLQLLESLHAKVLRQQALALQKIPPIVPEEDKREEPYTGRALEKIHEGQWFLLDTENTAPLRATLAARIESEQQLLFTNLAGVKILQLSFAEFARLMTRDKVGRLDTGASFSRSLARSAGVVSQADLDDVTGVAAERARLLEEQRQKAEQERVRLEQEEAEKARIEFERMQREQERLDQLQREQEEAERQRQELEEIARKRREKTELEYQRNASELEQIARLQQEWEEASRRYRDQAEVQLKQPGTETSHEKGATLDDSELSLPSGTWLGFRDGEEAVLARLAVYDRERNYYIFVDRHGVKMRQLSGRELLLLFARGVTDILESRPTFRDEVRRAQTESGS